MDKRISVFYTKSLQKAVLEAPQWMETHAIERIVWMANKINENIEWVEKEERFYEKPTNSNIELDQSNQAQLKEVAKIASIKVADLVDLTLKPVSSEEPSGESDADEAEKDQIRTPLGLNVSKEGMNL